ncbi:MAG TPA: hypothetical protein VJ208_03270 [Candidatus Nanoarchaeia archaeon]|nr:hypothetical protein [Candidatus Nanoarchaeia archaeon]
MDNIIYFEEFLKHRKQKEAEEELKQYLKEVRYMIYKINNYKVKKDSL